MVTGKLLPRAYARTRAGAGTRALLRDFRVTFGGFPLFLALFLTLPLAACATTKPDGSAGEPESGPATVTARDWRAIATDRDATRLRDWRPTLMAALADARTTDADKVVAAGDLLRPDAALDRPIPPAGDYDCLVTKLGSGHPGLLHYVAYPAFRCSVIAYPDGTAAFIKRTGSQRPVGTIYPAGPTHAVFLGTLQLSDERVVLPYGRDADRDLAARVERVGPARWRLLFPRPVYESIADVIELVPAR